MLERPSGESTSGFTLIEVAVAMAVLAIVLSGVLSGVTVAVVAATRSRDVGTATWLAAERMEQLRGLSWGLGDAAAPSAISDTSTDLSAWPASAAGAGLSPSPNTALVTGAPGFVDYLDGRGAWVGNGAAPPAAAVFERRWRVSRLPGSSDAVVLEVAVSRLDAARTAGRAPRPDDVRLMTVKARKGS